MKTATTRELRNEFGRVLRWLEKGETVQLLKRGRAFAKLVPERKLGGFLGCMAGTAKLPPDVEEPTGVKWNAMKSG